LRPEHKCPKTDFIFLSRFEAEQPGEKKPPLPDWLTDCLTGRQIPFSNKDNIRQKALRFLLDEKGYLKADISVDRTVVFTLDGEDVYSPVDIAINVGGLTCMVWKCASGSLVSRERQVIASSRLLEECVVALAVVTNGEDLELIDTVSEKVLETGFQAVPSRRDLLEKVREMVPKKMKTSKIIYEQRILYTYDAISCAPNCTPRASS